MGGFVRTVVGALCVAAAFAQDLPEGGAGDEQSQYFVFRAGPEGVRAIGDAAHKWPSLGDMKRKLFPHWTAAAEREDSGMRRRPFTPGTDAADGEESQRGLGGKKRGPPPERKAAAAKGEESVQREVRAPRRGYAPQRTAPADGEESRRGQGGKMRGPPRPGTAAAAEATESAEGAPASRGAWRGKGDRWQRKHRRPNSEQDRQCETAVAAACPVCAIVNPRALSSRKAASSEADACKAQCANPRGTQCIDCRLQQREQCDSCKTENAADLAAAGCTEIACRMVTDQLCPACAESRKAKRDRACFGCMPDNTTDLCAACHASEEQQHESSEQCRDCEQRHMDALIEGGCTHFACKRAVQTACPACMAADDVDTCPYCTAENTTAACNACNTKKVECATCVQTQDMSQIPECSHETAPEAPQKGGKDRSGRPERPERPIRPGHPGPVPASAVISAIAAKAAEERAAEAA